MILEIIIVLGIIFVVIIVALRLLKNPSGNTLSSDLHPILNLLKNPLLPALRKPVFQSQKQKSKHNSPSDKDAKKSFSQKDIEAKGLSEDSNKKESYTSSMPSNPETHDFHISSKNIDEVLKFIEDANLKDSVQFLQGLGQIRFNENAQIKSKKDAEDYILQEIIDYLKSKHESIKQKISELRKSGLDMEMESISLMSLPLKIKVFSATHKKFDLEKVTHIFSFLEEEISKIEKTKSAEETH